MGAGLQRAAKAARATQKRAPDHVAASERDRALRNAAPDLLAALKTTQIVLQNVCAPFGTKNGNEAIGEARLSEIRASLAYAGAAIAKAEGRSAS